MPPPPSPHEDVSDESSVASLTSSRLESNSAGPVQALTEAPSRTRRARSRSLSNTVNSFFTSRHPLRLDSDVSLLQLEVSSESHNIRVDDGHDFFGHNNLDRTRLVGVRDLERASAAPQGLAGEPREPEPVNGAQRSRRSSVTSIKRFGFFDKSFRTHRLHIYFTFAVNYLYLTIGFMFALTIYWGAYYNRNTRFKDLSFAVIIDEQQVEQTPPTVGSAVQYFFTSIPQVQQLGNFHFWNHSMIAASASANNRSISQEVNRQVHQLKYWGAIYVKENITYDWIVSLKSIASGAPSSSLAIPAIQAIYETGSDYNAVSNYITTVLNQISRAFEAFLEQSPIVPLVMLALLAQERAAILEKDPAFITVKPYFEFVDLIPVPEAVFQAPLQIGLIYLVIFTFFLFVFAMNIHSFIALQVLGLKFVFLRMLASQFSYCILSLSFVLLNRAFGMRYSVAFGYSGFLVIWMFSFLLMSALGSTIEILVLIAAIIRPQLIGFAMLVTAVFNVAPTVTPPVLCPRFYHYGYGIPVRNAYELFHVAYFDAWKGRVGRNIGVLLAWSILSNLLMPFALKLAAKFKAKAENKGKSEATEANPPAAS